jgi:hypothetical protein
MKGVNFKNLYEYSKKLLEQNCVAVMTFQEANITYPTQIKWLLKAIALRLRSKKHKYRGSSIMLATKEHLVLA